jgi:hypothetical protein
MKIAIILATITFLLLHPFLFLRKVHLGFCCPSTHSVFSSCSACIVEASLESMFIFFFFTLRRFVVVVSSIWFSECFRKRKKRLFVVSGFFLGLYRFSYSLCQEQAIGFVSLFDVQKENAIQRNYSLFFKLKKLPKLTCASCRCLLCSVFFICLQMLSSCVWHEHTNLPMCSFSPHHSFASLLNSFFHCFT